MTIETKYNIGDKVWWKTKNYHGSAKVEKVCVEIKKESSLIIYNIRTQEFVALVFYEKDLFGSEEELLKSL